ncbi:MAG TPA: ribosomal-processing cysteine protease Prp [Mollicutes bacterium]|nr:ribosomal-processing cysteine protease Prp [Mollicutes bacterium]
MIKIYVEKQNDQINKIRIHGHAKYDDYGRDIVCAAVSATVITTINGILSLSKTIDYVENKDEVIINVIKKDDITNKLLNNMLLMLSELEKDYPKNVKIN